MSRFERASHVIWHCQKTTAPAPGTTLVRGVASALMLLDMALEFDCAVPLVQQFFFLAIHARTSFRNSFVNLTVILSGSFDSRDPRATCQKPVQSNCTGHLTWWLVRCVRPGLALSELGPAASRYRANIFRSSQSGPLAPVRRDYFPHCLFRFERSFDC